MEIFDDTANDTYLSNEAFEHFYEIWLGFISIKKDKSLKLSKEEARELIEAYPPIKAMAYRNSSIDPEQLYIKFLLFSEYEKWSVWDDTENDTVFNAEAFSTFMWKAKQNYYFHQAFKAWAAMLIKNNAMFLHKDVVEWTKPSTMKFASEVLEGKNYSPSKNKKKPFSKVALRNTQIYSALKILVDLECQPTSNRLRSSSNFSASEVIAGFLADHGVFLTLEVIEGIWEKYKDGDMSEKDLLFFSDELTEFGI
ncbi:hypothetical protein F9L33_14695 [Amylibacter sp. SFDW26]|uniref:hypothetical protein n=1 Tax=Amylibacter sp. SFDW26 TaxID=2652722 RepID=UPI00126225BE|nr:hypothetical protein [Amylibacter sp. SFDW26]KAB7610140.1 hypothetical protein F9L33_14695 [Amylibacter sp. SFDW26]